MLTLHPTAPDAGSVQTARAFAGAHELELQSDGRRHGMYRRLACRLALASPVLLLRWRPEGCSPEHQQISRTWRKVATGAFPNHVTQVIRALLARATHWFNPRRHRRPGQTCKSRAQARLSICITTLEHVRLNLNQRKCGQKFSAWPGLWPDLWQAPWRVPWPHPWQARQQALRQPWGAASGYPTGC